MKTFYMFEDFLVEYTSESIEVYYQNDHVDFQYDEHKFELGVYRFDGEGVGNGILGLIEYTIYKNELRVAMVTVLPKYQRLGIASRLYQKMKEENPEAKYQKSYTTSDGTKFNQKTFTPSEMKFITLNPS